jgi:hypothetical protein
MQEEELMAKGKWTPQSRENARYRMEMRFKANDYWCLQEKDRKLKNLKTWFDLAEVISPIRKFDWHKELTLFVKDHDKATKNLTLEHLKLTEQGKI